MLGLMIEHGWIDRAFIDAHTVGFEQVAASCKEWPAAAWTVVAAAMVWHLAGALRRRG